MGVIFSMGYACGRRHLHTPETDQDTCRAPAHAWYRSGYDRRSDPVTVLCITPADINWDIPFWKKICCFSAEAFLLVNHVINWVDEFGVWFQFNQFWCRCSISNRRGRLLMDMPCKKAVSYTVQEAISLEILIATNGISFNGCLKINWPCVVFPKKSYNEHIFQLPNAWHGLWVFVGL